MARKALTALSRDTGDYWTDARVAVFDASSCAPVDFAREIYSRYVPCILQGMTDHWPARELWSREYLSGKMGEQQVSVNLTADGRADSVQPVTVHYLETDSHLTAPHFVYPAEVQMTLRDMFSLIERRDPRMVAYLSQQNDNLRTQLAPLMEDIDLYVPLAEQVFGTGLPEAVNLWIGDERSVSSMHKDHFENLYFVISGEKTFTLFPPTDCAFIPEATYPTARYVASSSSTCASIDATNATEFNLSLVHDAELPSSSLTWTDIDPDDMTVVDESKALNRFVRRSHPLRVTVRAGEALYLPAMWHHRVSQNSLTVAVNFWYDMRFDYRFVFYNAIQSLARIAKNEEEIGEQVDADDCDSEDEDDDEAMNTADGVLEREDIDAELS